jgi:hypothetical protein
MYQETPPITNLISTKQMKDAIQRSGYLLEQRVETVLANEGYFVQTNPAFQDSDTGKSREIDISALSARRIYKKGYDFIFPMILCECENNSQPVVFFTKESPISFMHHEQVKVSGIPVQFWQKDDYVSLPEFTGMEKFHHYCKGPIATQYCTFHLPKKDKSAWIALHNEEQHDTFSSLLKALDYEMAQHFDIWYPPDKVDEEEVNVQVYYPLLILQGSLYSATLKNNQLTLRKSKHIQFRKELFLPRTNEVETYQIDVITEEYLPDYLRIINSEIESVRKVFQRQRATILLSMEKIVEEVKKLKKKPKSYREYLEF